MSVMTLASIIASSISILLHLRCQIITISLLIFTSQSSWFEIGYGVGEVRAVQVVELGVDLIDKDCVIFNSILVSDIYIFPRTSYLLLLLQLLLMLLHHWLAAMTVIVIRCSRSAPVGLLLVLQDRLSFQRGDGSWSSLVAVVARP